MVSDSELGGFDSSLRVRLVRPAGFFQGFLSRGFLACRARCRIHGCRGYDQEIATFVSQHWQMSPLLLKGMSFVAIFFVVYFCSI